MGEAEAEDWLRLARFRAAAADTAGALAAIQRSRLVANASPAAGDSLERALRAAGESGEDPP